MKALGIKAVASLSTPGRLAIGPDGVTANGNLLEVDVGGVPGTELDARLLSLTGRRFRRLSRFIQLAMVGAVEAARRSARTLSAEKTGIFLATGLGNLSDMVPFSHAVFGDPGYHPSAIQFANSVGNSGAFYIAQALDVTGPVLALSQDEVSFQSALLQAVTLLEAGDIELAVVGSVDVVMPPVEDHLARMGYEPKDAQARGLKISEGSAWWVLGPRGEGDVGELEQLSLGQVDDLSTELVGLSDGLVTLCGSASAAAAQVPPERLKEWDVGALYSHSALASCLFLEQQGRAGDRLHVVSRTREGLTARFAVRRVAR